MIVPRRMLPFYLPVASEVACEAGAHLIPGVVVQPDATWCTRDKLEIVSRLVGWSVDTAALADWDRIDPSDWPGVDEYDATILPRARAYQPLASVFMAARESAMNCDEMRLGKTMEAFGGARLVGSKQLFVATLGTPKRGWGEDAGTWYGTDALMLDGRASTDMWWFCGACKGTGEIAGAPPASDDAVLGGAVVELVRCEACRGRGFRRPTDPWEALLSARVVVCNYDILIGHREKNMAGAIQHRYDLPGWVVSLRKFANIDTIILDESHKIGEKGARYRQVRELCSLSSVRRIWATTGTPDDGRLIKLWSQLDLITGGTWGTRKTFARRYCNGFDSEFGFTVPKNGRSPLADTELAESLQHMMIARTKADVAPHLPQLSRQVMRIEDTVSDRDQLQRPGIEGTEDALNRTAKRKLDHGGAVDFILQAMREGNKVALFVRNRETGHAISRQVTKAILSPREPALRAKRADVWDCIGKSYEARVSMADAFSKHGNTGDAKGSAAGLFVATIDGFQTGRSLQGVAYNVFFDLHWDALAIHQCEKRADTFERPVGLISIFIILAKSADEHVISVLLPKLDALWSVFKNRAAGEIRDVLSPKETLEQVWARHTAHLKQST